MRPGLFFRDKKMQPELDASPEKILIVGPSWVGDMVMAQSLFQLLRTKNPDVIIDVIAPAWSEPLLARIPEVRRTVVMPIGHGEFGLSNRFDIGRKMRAEAYRRAIVIPRSLKSALAPFFAGIPLRTGFRGEWRYGLLNDVRKLDRTKLDQTIKRFVALGVPVDSPVPVPANPVLAIDADNRTELMERLQLNGDGPAVALMPGAAYGPAKCWPIEHFAKLGAELISGGSRVWVLGSEGESAAGEEIRQKGGAAIRNLCGKTRLEDSIDLLSATRAAVTNDSGLMHVAAAVGTHVVAIYGSSAPSYTPPLTARKTIFYLDLECSPCFRRECPLGHLKCLRDIKPESVFADVQSILAGT
jgi:heptosyltransferase-2